MIKAILTLVFLTSLSAHADSIRWKVGDVQGTIETRGDLVLEAAQAVMACHYCSISTCAGGPTYKTQLPTKLTAENSTRFQLSVAGGSHRSGSFFKNHHSCSYVLHLKGRDQRTGNPVQGSIALAHSRKDSANPIWLDEMLSQGLTEVLTLRPLQVEVIKHGFALPEISTMDPVPYFGN